MTKIGIEIDRNKIVEAFRILAKTFKPKDKDGVIKKSVLWEIESNKLSLYMSNETDISMSFTDIPIKTKGSDSASFFIDLNIFYRFVTKVNEDVIKMSYDSTKEKLAISCGRSKMQIGYREGEEYREFLPDALKVPEFEDIIAIKEINKLRMLSSIMLKCASQVQPHLKGIWTDGAGSFMSYDGYKLMTVKSDNDWGFRSGEPMMLSSDFFGIIGLMPGDQVEMSILDNFIWLTDKEHNITCSVAMLSGDKFPLEDTESVIEYTKENITTSVEISAGTLFDSLSRINDIVGSQGMVCSLKFIQGGKLHITGVNENSDKLKEIINVKCDKDLDGFEFRAIIDSLFILKDLYEDTFTWSMVDDKSPMYTSSGDLGIEYFLAPYQVNYGE